MPTPPSDVTDAELSVLKALWELGPQTTRALADQLYPGGTASDYATVQKLLQRLEAKGHCERVDKKARPQVFRSTVDREGLIGSRLRAVADRLCGGSLAPLLTHLVQSDSLNASDRAALRELVDTMSKEETPDVANDEEPS